MRTMRMLAVAACAAFATAPAQQKEYHGTVVDAAGKPVAGAPVDTYWAVRDGKLAPRVGTRTDAEGKFKINVNTIRGRPTPLMAVDETVAFGAAVVLDNDHPENDLLLQFVPLVPVRGEITAQKLGVPIEGSFVSITYDKSVLALVGVACKGPFALQLPPGDYKLSYAAADCISTKGTATVAAGAQGLDLGTTDLAPTVLSQLYGKAPPEWNVSDARGVPKTVKLADYQGRWVLLEFWGFW